jgi:hypothetical protein
MMRFATILLLLCSALPAQLFTPFNLEAMPGASVQAVSVGYRPHLLIQWDPRTTPVPIRTHMVGIHVKLTVREIVVVHPPNWTGSWGGFTNIGARLISRNWPAVYGVWTWGGGGFEYIRGLDIELVTPSEIVIDYGLWSGACCYGYTPMPTMCAMLVEVSL